MPREGEVVELWRSPTPTHVVLCNVPEAFCKDVLFSMQTLKMCVYGCVQSVAVVDVHSLLHY